MRCPLTKESCVFGHDECTFDKCEMLNSFLFSSSGILLVILDKNSSIKYVNNALMHLTGFSKKELMEVNWLDKFIPDDEKEIIELVHKRVIVQETDKKVQFTNHILSKNGKKHLVAWHNYRIINGEINIVSVGMEITQSQFVVNNITISNGKRQTKEQIILKELTEITNRMAMIRQFHPLSTKIN